MIHKFEQLYSSYNFPDVKGIGIIQNFISILASWCQNRYINIKEVILHHKENKDDQISFLHYMEKSIDQIIKTNMAKQLKNVDFKKDMYYYNNPVGGIYMTNNDFFKYGNAKILKINKSA